jgi:hypothetical protein
VFGAEGAITDLRKVDGDCKAIGRDPKSLWKTGFTLGCVLQDGEAYDSPRARAQAGPQAIVILHNAVESDERGSPVALPPALQPALQAYRKIYQSFPRDERHLLLHAGHLTQVRPEDDAFLNGEFLRAVTMTGTRNEIRDRLATLEAGGFHEIAIQLVPGQEDALEQWAEVLGTRGLGARRSGLGRPSRPSHPKRGEVASGLRGGAPFCGPGGDGEREAGQGGICPTPSQANADAAPLAFRL